MFTSVIESGRLPGGCPLDEAGVEVDGQGPAPPGCPPPADEFDPADEVADLAPTPWSQLAPSGWSGLELDQATDDPARLSDAELIDATVGFERLAAWAGARQARVLAEFAARRPEIADSWQRRSRHRAGYSEFAADEVALALRCAHNTAAGRLHQAVTLAGELADTLAAWEAGRIDGTRARAIAETAWLLAPQQRAALQQRVLPRAGQQTPGQLRAALARAVLALDPDGAAARHRASRGERRVEVSGQPDGMASLWAWLSAPDASAAHERLGELARSLGADDPRGMDARRADLLVELITGRRCGATGEPTDDDTATDTADDTATATATAESDAAESDAADPDAAAEETDADADDAGAENAEATEPARPAPRGHACRPSRPGRPLVHVIVPITMLLGLDQTPGELVGHGPIPADTARAIAADGTWRRLLTDPASGTLLDHGRTRYTPPAGLADYVRARDVTCRFPTCPTPAERGDLDHTIPWPDGPTSPTNLHPPCRHHHRTKTHAPGWAVTHHPDGTITWTTPTGHIHTSYPHDYREQRPPPDDTDPDTDTDPDP